MNNLVKQDKYLPVKLNDLVKFVLVGREKLVSIRALIRAIDKMDIATGVREQKKEEATMLAGALLDAEARIGDLLKEKVSAGNPIVKAGGQLPKGITRNQSSQFQTLAEHPEIIEQVKAEAVKNDDLPTRAEVLRIIKEKERTNDIIKQKQEIIENNIKMPDGLFDVIVIDPPWPYDSTKYDPIMRRGTVPYPVMEIEALKNINIPTKKDCILWLWTTHKFIWDAKILMDFWGFEYKAILIWNKEKMGIGKWIRMQCEFCLLGIKGHPLWDVKDLRDIISESRREHSRKPEIFYKFINENFVGRKLDYYARIKRIGWEFYGTETKNF